MARTGMNMIKVCGVTFIKKMIKGLCVKLLLGC